MVQMATTTKDFINPPAGVKCIPKLQDTIFASVSSCSSDAGYSFWVIQAPPTADEVTSICQSDNCKTMINNMRAVAPSDCVMYDGFWLYKDILNPILSTCSTAVSTGEPPAVPASTTGAGATSTTSTTTTTAPGVVAPSASSPATNTAASGSSGSNSTVIAISIGGVVVVVVLLVLVVFIKRQKKRDAARPVETQHMSYGNIGDFDTVAPSMYTNMEAGYMNNKNKSHKSDNMSTASTASYEASRSSSGHTKPLDLSQIPLLKDDQILTSRVPVDKVKIGALLKSGGFGQVYKGTYKGQVVAIKRLLPSHRTSTKQINDFLKEVKLMASLDHERIVQFVGVAWKTEDDICVLIEFMAKGDLRGQLENWKKDQKPMGFDATKLKIAVHVAHALTYLHSLQPIILHRDLKSHNILLSNNYDAKLTDFGISRENADATMTRGVGTSLWMAPEVMMGGRYDDKADVFCFGIVMSELDTNDLPYAAQVDVKSSQFNILEVLQDVSRGRLTVDFSYVTDPDIVAIGRDCVAVDPRDRPTMEQVLDRLNHVWQQFC